MVASITGLPSEVQTETAGFGSQPVPGSRQFHLRDWAKQEKQGDFLLPC